WPTRFRKFPASGIDNTISGPALSFQVDPAVAARAGFTPEELELDASAILQGEPAATPVVPNDRAYTARKADVVQPLTDAERTWLGRLRRDHRISRSMH